MTTMPQSLVLATTNAGKVRELSQLFQDLPIDLKSLNDFDVDRDVDETGSTFYENAVIKAEGFARQTRHLTLADDSGLEIDALGNEPGVRSARFAGVDTGYEIKIPKLLALLDATGDIERRARFVCAMAVADAEGRIIHTAEGICSGSIARTPVGDRGFGYDPIFVPDGFNQTFGELSDDTKQTISHRAKAAALIMRFLLDFIAM